MRLAALAVLVACHSSSKAPDERALRDHLVAVQGHLDVLKTTPGFGDYRDVVRATEATPGVVAAEPFVQVAAVVQRGDGKPFTIDLKGVDPERVGRVLDLASVMTTGDARTLAASQTAVVLGSILAETLHAHVGDVIAVTAPGAAELRVVGTFRVGFDAIDERLAIAPFGVVQAIAGRGDQALGVEARVADVEKSEAIARNLQRTIGGPPYVVKDWYELNTRLFHALYGDRRP
jgi:lipoprotein-releasing system permease protein